MSANGYPLAAAVLCAALASWIWMHARREDGGGALPASTARGISVLAALAATFAVAGITPWRDALARVFGTGPGMVVLVVIVVFSAGMFVVDHLKHHHPVRSTAFAIVGASTGALAWAMAPELGKRGSKIGPATAAAMGQAQQQIRSGRAARDITGGGAAMTVFLAVLALIVLIAVMRAHHNKRPFATAKYFGQPPALTAAPPKAIATGHPGPAQAAPGNPAQAAPGKAGGKQGNTGFFAGWGGKK